jgi:hypothetical protein
LLSIDRILLIAAIIFALASAVIVIFAFIQKASRRSLIIAFAQSNQGPRNVAAVD